MFRCLIAAFAAVFAMGASAQSLRHFPADALRGELVVGAAPDVQINGQAARLGAGARVRGIDNLVKMPASLAGQKFLVHYTVDPQGLLREVWILSEAEAAKKPWPTSAKEAGSWRFDAVAQAWSKP
ncbi:MAG: hypothetical protein KF788_02860 [Piscinibacter sp.]|nr:hypothetical protein [Piscinibacter sp.]